MAKMSSLTKSTKKACVDILKNEPIPLLCIPCRAYKTANELLITIAQNINGTLLWGATTCRPPKTYQFINKKNNDYFHPELGIILEDLHDENVLTQQGILYFIDTVFYLKSEIFWE